MLFNPGLALPQALGPLYTQRLKLIVIAASLRAGDPNPLRHL
jgi:hypothetical protein